MRAIRRLACVAAATALAGCIPVRYADCGGGTVRLADDPAHCGGCHVACPGGVPCVDGACVVPEGATVCPDQPAEPDEGDPPETASDPAAHRRIADLRTDPRHCGECGHACPDGASCVDGACSCDAGRTPCLLRRDEYGGWAGDAPDLEQEPWRWDEPNPVDGFLRACVDTANDPMSCGGCQRVCPTDSTCVDGECSCRDGLTFCARETIEGQWVDPPDAFGLCADLSTFQTSCGACGDVCADGGRCVDGACLPCCGAEPTMSDVVPP